MRAFTGVTLQALIIEHEIESGISSIQSQGHAGSRGSLGYNDSATSKQTNK